LFTIIELRVPRHCVTDLRRRHGFAYLLASITTAQAISTIK
jgi:hypothetical protein